MMAERFGSVDGRVRFKTSGWPKNKTIMSCKSEKGPLLTRYFLTPRNFGPIAIYLHKFITGDEDRALHDHPYTFITCLLSSGYWEHVAIVGARWDSVKGDWVDAEAVQRVWRRRFSILYRPAEFKHRVELETSPTWTLVIRFRRRRMWGFWTERGWMDWRSYGKEWCD